MAVSSTWRQTTQHLAPSQHPGVIDGHYDLYPAHPVGPGQIEIGYDALAAKIATSPRVIIDGYVGVLWGRFRESLDAALRRKGVGARWLNIETALRPEAAIDWLAAPFLGGDDPLFGTRFTGCLKDFFEPSKLGALRPTASPDELHITYGCGAALVPWDGLFVYVDLPKNEIQFRARAGSIRNLGSQQAEDSKRMYKRFYFVDWVALNRHKAELLPRIDWVVDGQRPDEPAIMAGRDLRKALQGMTRNCFRVRPWFEPGPWGGQWIKEHMPELAREVSNYAWSFELISPENGVMLESDGRLIEVSFDFLMFHDASSMLGDAADRFGCEFPIRFDFLDTFAGGNLSLQCHPRPGYIRRHFGESFTQDETYYILDCRPDARVYLGFQENVDPAAFRAALDRHGRDGAAVDVDAFVQSLPARRPDHLLIPSGTIHCSGVNNLVLEISATPYIFTFKMYDWMRMDLDGRPRPLNVDRAFENLAFERRGKRVREELVSRPAVLREGRGWRLVDLPTHREHFYGVHRYEFTDSVDGATEGSCHVMNLVQGESILLQTAGGVERVIHYAETFVVPAAAERYRLVNLDGGPAMVVKAFVKPDSVIRPPAVRG